MNRHTHNWEDLAVLDPFWAVLSLPGRKFGNWDLDSFFRTGRHEVDHLMQVAAELNYPRHFESALDFGCGVGRVTAALARRFTLSYGVDISPHMIQKAQQLNRTTENLRFVLNPGSDLHIFDQNQFDLVYSSRVLQHIPSRPVIRQYLRDFVRILKPDGLLVFQLPSYIPLWRRTQPRARAYELLRAVGIAKTLLYKKLQLVPMRLNFMRARDVLRVLASGGARVLRIESGSMRWGIEDQTYYSVKLQSLGG